MPFSAFVGHSCPFGRKRNKDVLRGILVAARHILAADQTALLMKTATKPKQRRAHTSVKVVRDHQAELRYRAERWAELHADPKTRAQMDKQLDGLSIADMRHVYLQGERLSAGMPYKAQPDQPTKGKTDEHPRRNSRGNHSAQAKNA